MELLLRIPRERYSLYIIPKLPPGDLIATDFMINFAVGVWFCTAMYLSVWIPQNIRQKPAWTIKNHRDFSIQPMMVHVQTANIVIISSKST
jgi:hypothetical protein